MERVVHQSWYWNSSPRARDILSLLFLTMLAKGAAFDIETLKVAQCFQTAYLKPLNS